MIDLAVSFRRNPREGRDGQSTKSGSHHPSDDHRRYHNTLIPDINTHSTSRPAQTCFYARSTRTVITVAAISAEKGTILKGLEVVLSFLFPPIKGVFSRRKCR